jgi:hypothetical protein
MDFKIASEQFRLMFCRTGQHNNTSISWLSMRLNSLISLDSRTVEFVILEKNTDTFNDSYSTGWSKSHSTHSWHVFSLSKNKLRLNKKTKLSVVSSFGNVQRVQKCMHSLFLRVSCNSMWRVPVSRKRSTRPETADLFGTEESENISPNSRCKVR